MTEMHSGPSLLPLSGKTKNLVLLFHGYGADGNDLISLAQDWASALPDTEFIAPNAPFRCEQNPFGRQWFSMVDWTMDKILQGLRDVAPVVKDYIEETLKERELSTQDLALVGFSQGSMLALYQAYYVLSSCAGVIAYSGTFLEDINVQPKNLPKSLLIHGDADSVVPVEGTLMAGEIIKKIGGNPQIVIQEGLHHAIDSKGLMLGEEFLQNVLGYAKMNPSTQ